MIAEHAHISLIHYELGLAEEAIDHTGTKMTSPQIKALRERARETSQLFMDYFAGDLAFHLALQGVTPYAICSTLVEQSAPHW
jgi:hypothetical protein